MTIADARLALLGLPDDIPLVVSCSSPQLRKVISLSVREANFFLDGSLWRPLHQIHVVSGKEVEHRKIKVLEVDF